MKRALVLTVAFVLVASVAFGASITTSKHNLAAGGPGAQPGVTTTQVCVFCHAPHNAAAGTIPVALWNHTDTTQSFTMYKSATVTGAISAQPAGISRACLTCHDGSVAVNSVINAPNDGVVGTLTKLATTSGANMGTNLQTHHPVSITYEPAKDAGLKASTGSNIPGPGGVNLPLFGAATPFTVECGSCHNVHDPVNVPFLRASNNNSGLCVACHNK